MKVISFYEKSDPYYEFSNFYMKAPFVWDGMQWPSVEHYFQAKKFIECPEYMEYIRQCDGTFKVFALGRQKCFNGFHINRIIHKTDCKRLVNEVVREFKHVPIRSDWEHVKDTVMRDGLMAKFSQNETLKQMLLDTGDAELVEKSPRDAYWGVGKDGRGRNRLGELLMEVREGLRTTP